MDAEVSFVDIFWKNPYNEFVGYIKLRRSKEDASDAKFYGESVGLENAGLLWQYEYQL